MPVEVEGPSKAGSSRGVGCAVDGPDGDTKPRELIPVVTETDLALVVILVVAEVGGAAKRADLRAEGGGVADPVP